MSGLWPTYIDNIVKQCFTDMITGKQPRHRWGRFSSENIYVSFIRRKVQCSDVIYMLGVIDRISISYDKFHEVKKWD